MKRISYYKYLDPESFELMLQLDNLNHAFWSHLITFDDYKTLFLELLERKRDHDSI